MKHHILSNIDYKVDKLVSKYIETQPKIRYGQLIKIFLPDYLLKNLPKALLHGPCYINLWGRDYFLLKLLNYKEAR